MEILLAVIVAILGSAGLVGLVGSLEQWTRPARLRRRVETAAGVRDQLPDGSAARSSLDEAIESAAEKLAAALTRPPATKDVVRWGWVFAGNMIGGVALALLVVDLTSDDPFADAMDWLLLIGALTGGAVAAKLYLGPWRPERDAQTSSFRRSASR